MSDHEAPAEIALGHYLTLRRPIRYGSADGEWVDAGDGYYEMRFQNFWIGTDAIWIDPDIGKTQIHSFLPFGFSGVSMNKSGDNVDASLVLPNNELARSFADNAIREQWTGIVRVVMVNNLTDASVPPQLLMRYAGLISSGGWSDTSITLRLNTVLDAVTGNVPARTVHQATVGDVPISGSLSLS